MTGKEFREWRERMGLTVSETARQFGHDRRAIQRWDKRRKPNRMLTLACKGFEVERKQTK